MSFRIKIFKYRALICFFYFLTIPYFVYAQNPSRTEEIVILGLNDIHGTLLPIKETVSEGDQKGASYLTGGGLLLSGYIKIARQKFGENLLVLDAGDQFQGSIESNSTEGLPMVKLFNLLGLDAAAIGNHEFDFGPIGPDRLDSSQLKKPQGALIQRLSEARYPYLSANIEQSHKNKPPKWPNFKKSTILKVGKLKIGVMGITTTTTPVTTQAKFVSNLKFNAVLNSTLTEAKRLRNKGAHVVILVAHEGLECQAEPGGKLNKNKVRTLNDPQGKCEDSELAQALHQLPQGSLDAVVAGHRHAINHHFINGVPVIQSGRYGQYFHMIKLSVDIDQKRVLSGQSQITGPFQVCEKIFSNQDNCEGKDPAPAQGRGGLTPAVFLDTVVTPDPVVQEYVSSVSKEVSAFSNQVIGESQNEILHHRDEESPMGNLITDALRGALKTDFALMNRGGIRYGLPAGKITYGDLFKVLPFDNFVSKVEVTGAELKTILRIAQSGFRGVFPVSGMKVVMRGIKSSPLSEDDLNQDGKKEHWEVNRIYEITRSDGSPIEDTASYSLATVDFLINGGDDMGFAFKNLPKEKLTPVAGPIIRDVVEQYIRGYSGVLNSQAQPLLDPKNPRFVFKD